MIFALDCRPVCHDIFFFGLEHVIGIFDRNVILIFYFGYTLGLMMKTAVVVYLGFFHCAKS